MTALPVHLVLGASGQVGFELVRALPVTGRVIGLSRPEVDLERPETLRDAIRVHRPTVIWNAAAATAVDALEDDPDRAFRVNALAPSVIAEEARRAGALMVQFSTDYVFDGTKVGQYVEQDVPNPLNTYGRSKLAGEQAILEVGGRSLIIRTSWVYSARGRNFLQAIVGLAGTTDPVRVVSDQIGAPTWSREIARLCTLLHARGRGDDGSVAIVHMTASGSCSWFEFACHIRDQLIELGKAWRPDLVPVTSEAYGARALRPANSILSNDLLLRRLGEGLGDWRSSTRELMAGL